MKRSAFPSPRARLLLCLPALLPLLLPTILQGQNYVRNTATFGTSPDFASNGQGRIETQIKQLAVFRDRSDSYEPIVDADDSRGNYVIAPPPDNPSVSADDEVFGQPRLENPLVVNAVFAYDDPETTTETEELRPTHLLDNGNVYVGPAQWDLFTDYLDQFQARVREAWQLNRGGVITFDNPIYSQAFFEDADGDPVEHAFADRDIIPDSQRQISSIGFAEGVAKLGASGTFEIRFVGNSTLEEQEPRNLGRWEGTTGNSFMIEDFKGPDLNCFGPDNPGWVDVDVNPDPAVEENKQMTFLTVGSRDNAHTVISGDNNFGVWTVDDLRFNPEDRIVVIGFGIMLYNNFQRFQSLDGSFTNPYNVIAEIRMTNPDVEGENRHAYSAAHASSQECIDCATPFFAFEVPHDELAKKLAERENPGLTFPDDFSEEQVAEFEELSRGYYIDRLLVRGIGNNCRTFDRIDDLSIIVEPSITIPEEIAVPFVEEGENNPDLQFPFLQRLIANNNPSEFTVEGELPTGLSLSQDERTGEWRISGVVSLDENDLNEQWILGPDGQTLNPDTGEPFLRADSSTISFKDVKITAVAGSGDPADNLEATVDFYVRNIERTGTNAIPRFNFPDEIIVFEGSAFTRTVELQREEGAFGSPSADFWENERDEDDDAIPLLGYENETRGTVLWEYYPVPLTFSSVGLPPGMSLVNNWTFVEDDQGRTDRLVANLAIFGGVSTEVGDYPASIFVTNERYGITVEQEILVRIVERVPGANFNLGNDNITESDLATTPSEGLEALRATEDRASDLFFHDASTGATQAWFNLDEYLAGILETPQVVDGPVLPPAQWEQIRLGDFNGDLASDIFAVNRTTGKPSVWLAINSETVVPGPGEDESTSFLRFDGFTDGFEFLFSVGGYDVLEARDFNNDAIPDLLLANRSSNQVAIFLLTILTGTLNGEPVLYGLIDRSRILLPADSSYVFEALGDFNADGVSDFLYRDETTGEVRLEILSSGLQLDSSIVLREAGNTMQVAAVAPLNGDRTDDIVWLDPATGAYETWMMSGASIPSNDGIDLTAGDEEALVGNIVENQVEAAPGKVWRLLAAEDFGSEVQATVFDADSGQDVEATTRDGLSLTVNDMQADTLWVSSDGRLRVIIMDGAFRAEPDVPFETLWDERLPYVSYERSNEDGFLALLERPVSLIDFYLREYYGEQGDSVNPDIAALLGDDFALQTYMRFDQVVRNNPITGQEAGVYIPSTFYPDLENGSSEHTPNLWANTWFDGLEVLANSSTNQNDIFGYAIYNRSTTTPILNGVPNVASLSYSRGGYGQMFLPQVGAGQFGGFEREWLPLPSMRDLGGALHAHAMSEGDGSFTAGDLQSALMTEDKALSSYTVYERDEIPWPASNPRSILEGLNTAGFPLADMSSPVPNPGTNPLNTGDYKNAYYDGVGPDEALADYRLYEPMGTAADGTPLADPDSAAGVAYDWRGYRGFQPWLDFFGRPRYRPDGEALYEVDINVAGDPYAVLDTSVFPLRPQYNDEGGLIGYERSYTFANDEFTLDSETVNPDLVPGVDYQPYAFSTTRDMDSVVMPDGRLPAGYSVIAFDNYDGEGGRDILLARGEVSEDGVVSGNGEIYIYRMSGTRVLNAAAPPVRSDAVGLRVLPAASFLGKPLEETLSYSTFQQWQIDAYGDINAFDAQPGRDPEGDGKSNRVEYAQGVANPLTEDLDVLALESSGSGPVTLTYYRRADDDQVAVTFQRSTDMQNWTTIEPSAGQVEVVRTRMVNGQSIPVQEKVTVEGSDPPVEPGEFWRVIFTQPDR